MPWKRVDNISLNEAFERANRGEGILKIRKVVRRGEKAIEYYVWEES